MTRQEFRLRDWDWDVVAFYDAGPEDADEVFRALRDAHCTRAVLSDSYDILYRFHPNRGLTYTNNALRRSVMLIGRTTCAAQFMDSYDHEKGHLCEHICEAEGIGTKTEEKQYLAGEIGRQTFAPASKYLCEHCRATSRRRRLVN